MILASKRIVTGDGKSILFESALLIKNEMIAKVGLKEDLIRQFPKEKIKDYGDATIIPGLMDMHTHIGMHDACEDAEDYNDYRLGILGQKQLEQCFQWGCTTIRDAGCPDGLLESLRRAANNGFILVPRIFHANIAIAMSGGHCWELTLVMEADGVCDCIKKVREQIRGGADWIKIMTGHRTNTPEFTQTELNEMVKEAHRLGRKVEIHAALHPALEMAIESGCDSVEHGTYLDVALASKMQERNIYWTPTMSFLDYWTDFFDRDKSLHNEYMQGSKKTYPYFKRGTEYIQQHFVEVVKASGVKIITGTDCDNGYHQNGSACLEVGALINCGFDPLFAIQAGSYNCAEILGISDRVGLLNEGYIADIAVVNGDPTKDWTMMADILETFYAGNSVYVKENDH